MGFYNDQVVPRVLDVMLAGKAIDQLRARVAAGLSGEVLEVGIGSGRNVPFYPRSVTRVQAVDPATVGRKLAARRIAASPVPVDFIGLDGTTLPVDSESVDHVLITWTLCTIPDAAKALSEMRRVLRPGGTVCFVEHGLSPDPEVRKWQERLTPLQRRVAGGCNLNRPIDRLVAESGLEVQEMNTYYAAFPKSYSYMFEGVAQRV